MREFNISGHIDFEKHYYISREDLVNEIYKKIIGDIDKGGSFIILSSPPQTGKTTIVKLLEKKIDKEQFSFIFIPVNTLKNSDETTIVKTLEKRISSYVKDPPPIKNFPIETWKDFAFIFHGDALYFNKPVILVLDGIDSFDKPQLEKLLDIFQDIYINQEKYWLHGLLLIGNIPPSINFYSFENIKLNNFSLKEVQELFNQYIQETGRKIEDNVIKNIFYEFNGHPGLTCWFAKILIKECKKKNMLFPINIDDFNYVYNKVQKLIPNNFILGLIQKIKNQENLKEILKLFSTFTYEIDITNPILYSLFSNGIIDYEEEYTKSRIKGIIKFSSPFLYKKLFWYLSNEIIEINNENILEPFDYLEDIFIKDKIILKNIIGRYQKYINKKGIKLKNNIIDISNNTLEGIFHIHFFKFLKILLENKDIDTIDTEIWKNNIFLKIEYLNKIYFIILLNFKNIIQYEKNIESIKNFFKNKNFDEAIVGCFSISLSKNMSKKLIERNFYLNKKKIEVYAINFKEY